MSSSSLPAESRWGTLGESLMEFTAGVVAHQALPRAFLGAFADDRERDENEEDWHAFMHKKVKRSRDLFLDSFKLVISVLFSVISEPMDWLMARIQHLDDTASPLWDIQLPNKNPFSAVWQRWSDMLLKPISETCLGPLLRHFAVGKTEDEFLLIVRGAMMCIITVAAQFQWRIIDTWSDWPWNLAAICHPSIPGQRRLALAEELFKTNVCCLDAPCTRKIRKLFPSAAAMIEDCHFMRGMRMWCRRSKLSNMHIERQISLMRSSVSETTPSMERLVSSGLLAQVGPGFGRCVSAWQPVQGSDIFSLRSFSRRRVAFSREFGVAFLSVASARFPMRGLSWSPWTWQARFPAPVELDAVFCAALPAFEASRTIVSCHPLQPALCSHVLMCHGACSLSCLWLWVLQAFTLAHLCSLEHVTYVGPSGGNWCTFGRWRQTSRDSYAGRAEGRWRTIGV